TRCSFAPGVAEKLVEDLQKTKVETLKGETIEIIGQFVEPVQLQVVCQNLWNELPPDVMVITEEYRAKNVDIDRPLAKFYENAISEAVKQTGIPENILRDWCVKWLITSTGTRGIVHRGQKETDGIPNRALEILEDMHLLRSVWRAGAHWYELTHDRFIDPIRTSNESWRGEKADQALILIREAEQDINFQKYQRALDASRSAYLISEEVGDLQSEAIALLYHGKAYEGLKQNGEALTSYTKALGIVKQTKAREVETYVLLSQGSLFMQMNDYEKALQCYTNYITLLPNDSVGYYNLGLTYFNLGENERAIDHYTHALVLDPGDVDAYNNRGRTYYKLGDYE
ncbi:MAG TPA: tetratricopeptide repeat protein, partial [Ktedonobacteraceae bacterium]|nr:tetratricopeptide repeat protein [Ktedonobacteraceae bacterium]